MDPLIKGKKVYNLTLNKFYLQPNFQDILHATVIDNQHQLKRIEQGLHFLCW